MRTKNEIGSSDWFGEIPEGWETLPTKALFTTTKGMTVTKADLVEDGAPVVNYGQVHSKANSGFHLSDELVRYVPEDFVKAGLRKSTFGSFIFACTSEDMEGCGACVYNDSGIEVNPGGDTMLLSPKENGDNRFYAYLFSTDEWRWQLRRNLVDVKVFHVNQTDLKETYVVVPPLSEQQRIADYLDAKCAAIDADAAKRRELVEKLKEYRKSVIAHAVTRGLDAGAPMRDSGIEWIGEIPEGWDCVTIGRHYVTSLGKMLNSKAKETNTVNMPYLCAANVSENGFDLTLVKEMPFRRDEIESYSVCDGDLVVIEGGNVGAASIWHGKPICIQNALHRVRPKKAENINFLRYWLSCAKSSGYINATCNGATFLHLTKDKLLACPMAYPPLSEQRRIADYLDAKCAAIDAAIAKQEQLIEKLGEYRKSTIHAAVTGRIDLSQGA